MSLEYAILGFLNYHPYTGYDLKKTFDKSVRHFWPADQSQIYRTLSRLTDQGFVEMERSRQADRPDRKVYHITPAGRAALLAWLAGPPPLHEPRSAPLIQVFFMAQLADEEILQRFEGYAQVMRMFLDRYEQVPADVQEIYTDVQSERERFFWLLTLESGIANMRSSWNGPKASSRASRMGSCPRNRGRIMTSPDLVPIIENGLLSPVVSSLRLRGRLSRGDHRLGRCRPGRPGSVPARRR